MPTEPAAPTAPTAPPAPAPPLAPEALARTLRAVAAELERDPALARRVAAALAAPPEPDTPTPAPQPPATDRRGDERTGDERGHERPESKSPRAARAFTPRLITGASPALGPGVPDPFALQTQLGTDGLRAALEELRLGSLRAIAREHGLDPGGKVSRQNDAARLRELILAAVATHGR